MRRFHMRLLALGCSLSLFGFGETSRPSRLEWFLRSGDRVQAEIDGFEAGTFELAPRWSEDGMPLPQSELLMVQRRNRTTSLSQSPPHRLVYENGDEVSGTLLEMDGETLKLESVWGDVLTLRRNRLLRVDLRADLAKIEVDGIARMEGWEGQPWRFAPTPMRPIRVGGEVFRQEHPHHRFTMPFPAIERSFTVELGMRVPEQNVNFMMTAFQDFSFRFYQDTLRIDAGNLGMTLKGPDIWSTDLDELPEGFRRLTLVFDATDSTMHFYLNRQYLRTWQIQTEDPLPFHRPGHWEFNIQTRNSVTMDQYRVLSYPSRPPHPADPPEEGFNARIALQNGDQLQANIEWVRNGMISLILEDDLKGSLRLGAVSEIRFTEPEASSMPAGHAKQGVEVRLGPAESRFVLTHLDFDAEFVRGTSPHLNAPLQIPWAEVDLIDFDPLQRAK